MIDIVICIVLAIIVFCMGMVVTIWLMNKNYLKTHLTDAVYTITDPNGVALAQVLFDSRAIATLLYLQGPKKGKRYKYDFPLELENYYLNQIKPNINTDVAPKQGNILEFPKSDK